MPVIPRINRLLTPLAAVALAPFLAHCASSGEKPLTAPRALVAPYDTASGEVLWAVAPLRNESGIESGELPPIADQLVAAAEQVRGVRTVPLNRTLQAMAALDLRAIRSPADARKLADAMGVDAILVGSVTAYDPYAPALGLTVALYNRPGAMTPGQRTLDARNLTASASETPQGRATRFTDSPIAIASMHLDGTDNQVKYDVQAYAAGKEDSLSALGWRRYIESMPLFCEFAAYHAMDDLIRQEWLRLGRVAAATDEP